MIDGVVARWVMLLPVNAGTWLYLKSRREKRRLEEKEQATRAASIRRFF
jgi:hypothetical protein